MCAVLRAQNKGKKKKVVEGRHVRRRDQGKDPGLEMRYEMTINKESVVTEDFAGRDGAIWIWMMVFVCFPRRIEILDWWHMLQYVWQLVLCSMVSKSVGQYNIGK